jgi:hypothetical protein
MPASRFVYEEDFALQQVHYEEAFLMVSSSCIYRSFDPEETSQHVDTTFGEAISGPKFNDFEIQACWKFSGQSEQLQNVPPFEERGKSKGATITFCKSLLDKLNIKPSNRDHVIIEEVEYSFIGTDDPRFWDERVVSYEVSIVRFQ